MEHRSNDDDRTRAETLLREAMRLLDESGDRLAAVHVCHAIELVGGRRPMTHPSEMPDEVASRVLRDLSAPGRAAAG